MRMQLRFGYAPAVRNDQSARLPSAVSLRRWLFLAAGCVLAGAPASLVASGPHPIAEACLFVVAACALFVLACRANEFPLSQRRLSLLAAGASLLNAAFSLLNEGPFAVTTATWLSLAVVMFVLAQR